MGDAVQHEKHPDQLTEKLGLEKEASHADLRRAFLDRVKVLTHESPYENIEKVETELEEICMLFFEYNYAIIKNMAAGLPEGSNDHPDAGSVKTQAGAIKLALQKAIIAFACCELTLHATTALVDADMAEKSKTASEKNKDMRLPNDLSQQIAVALRRRETFSEYALRMRRATETLKKLDPVYTVFEGELHFLLGDKRSEELLKKFNAQLKKLKFLKAEEMIQQAQKKDSKAFFRRKKKIRAQRWELVLEISYLTTELLKRVVKQLKGREDILYLRSHEMNAACEDLEKQLKQTKAFIDKYETPEIKLRRDALGREKARLYELGTFESYLEILEGLQKGASLPMTSLKDVRGFEENFYKRAVRITEDKATMVEQIKTKVEKLSKGPDPQSVPDSMIFSEEGKDEMEQFLAG